MSAPTTGRPSKPFPHGLARVLPGAAEDLDQTPECSAGATQPAAADAAHLAALLRDRGHPPAA